MLSLKMYNFPQPFQEQSLLLRGEGEREEFRFPSDLKVGVIM